MRNYYIFVILLGILVISLVIVGFIVGGTPVAQKNVHSTQYGNTPLNSAQQVTQANNLTRQSDIAAILNAINQYANNNNGALPEGVPAVGTTKNITSTEMGSAFCTALVPTYISALPHDPAGGTYTDCSNYDTQYQISIATPVEGSTTPRVTISAPNAALDPVMSTTR